MADETQLPNREDSENKQQDRPAATSMACDGNSLSTEQKRTEKNGNLVPFSRTGAYARLLSVLKCTFSAFSSLIKVLLSTFGLIIKSFTFGNIAKLFLLQHLWDSWQQWGETSRRKGGSLWDNDDPPIYHSKPKQHFSFEPVGYTYENSMSSYRPTYNPHVSSMTGDVGAPDVAATLQQKLSSTNAAVLRVAGGMGGCYDKDSTAFKVALGMVPIYSPPPKDNGTCAIDDSEAVRDVDILFPLESSPPGEKCTSNDNETMFTLLGSVGRHAAKDEKTHSAGVTLSFKGEGRTVNNQRLGVNLTEELSRSLSVVAPPSFKRTVVVLDLHLGMDPSITGDITFVRNAVTFLVGQARDLHSSSSLLPRSTRGFEVVVSLKSNGGSVTTYGLLAEQLRRLRTESGVTLTVCCDQTALSGGYMMAALASPGHLLATPFASIGSIGVATMEMLNFNKALEGWGVKPLQFHGGDAKAPISFFGEVSEEDAERMQKRIDATHKAFRAHVERWRGDAIKDYAAVTNGDYWVGEDALKLGLVDRLASSDEYIDERVRDGDRVLKLVKYKKKNLAEKLGLMPAPFPWDDGMETTGHPKSMGSAVILSTLQMMLILVDSFAALFGKED